MTTLGVQALRLHDLVREPALLAPHWPGAIVFEVDCDRVSADFSGAEQAVRLSTQDRLALERMRDPCERGRAAALLTALHGVLGACLRSPADRLLLCRDGQGRLCVPAHPTLIVSTSRSGKMGALALSCGTDVGVDLEVTGATRFPPAIAPEILHDREALLFAEVAPAARSAWLARAWVCKEAVLKAMGLGLSVDPRRLEVMATTEPLNPQGEPFAVPAYQPWQGWVRSCGTVLVAVAGFGRLARLHWVRLDG